MPERGGTQGTFLSPYQVQVASGQYRMAGQATASGWFGALAPLPANIPPDVRGRAYDYMPGVNLQNQPKVGEGLSFATLRAVADAHDLLRLVIETRKDQIARMRWAIKPRETKGSGNDARCAAITAFLRKPDGVTPFRDWLRSLIEDLLVLDAPTLFKQRDNAGRLLALEQIDGATILRVIADDGRTPVPLRVGSMTIYPVAYQQVLKGGRLNYTVQEILYAPRNKRIWKTYGFSPVEQVITTVNIALRRQQTTLEYFTGGSVPDSLIGVPDTWTPDQIRQFQGYWDQIFTGDTAARRRAKFIPGGMKVTQTREPVLKDEFDEWLARVICYAFSVSPQALSRMMNRATAETNKGSAEEEGFAPLLDWIKGLLDEILEDEFDAGDLEFAWQQDAAVDEVQQAAILKELVGAAIMTPNEARKDRGMDPDPDPAADKLMVLTATGYMLLNANTIEGKQAMQEAFPPPAPSISLPSAGAHDGGAPLDGGAGSVAERSARGAEPARGGMNGRQSHTRAIAKVAGDDPEDDEPEPLDTAADEQAITDALAPALAAAADDVAGQVETGLTPIGDQDHRAEHVVATVAAIIAGLSFGRIQTLDLATAVAGALRAAGRIGLAAGVGGAGALGAADVGAARSISDASADARAAALLGLRWTGTAERRSVETDPGAVDSIVDTLRENVGKAVDAQEPGEGLAARAAAAVRALLGFQRKHAETIGIAEAVTAANTGLLTAYTHAAVALNKRWVTESEACPTCLANAAEGAVALGHVFKSGQRQPGAHPRCRCRLVCESETFGKVSGPGEARDATGR